jgi:hypothetical protein
MKDLPYIFLVTDVINWFQDMIAGMWLWVIMVSTMAKTGWMLDVP